MVVVVLVMVVVMVVMDFGSVLFCNGDFLCEGCVIVQWDLAAAPWVQDPSLASIARSRASCSKHHVISRDAWCSHRELTRCLLHPFPLREFVRRKNFGATVCPSHKNSQHMFWIFVRRDTVAQIFVRQCARCTKTHNTRSEFLCDGCPLQRCLYDSLPIAQKFMYDGCRLHKFLCDGHPSYKNSDFF